MRNVAICMALWFAGIAVGYGFSDAALEKAKFRACEEHVEKLYVLIDEALALASGIDPEVIELDPIIINATDTKDGIEWKWDRETEANIVNKPKGTTKLYVPENRVRPSYR